MEQLAPVPSGLNIIEAAAVPVDALTAEQGLTDVLAVGRGDQVLITAGAGGLGHFAVQIARILGASVVAGAGPASAAAADRAHSRLARWTMMPCWMASS